MRYQRHSIAFKRELVEHSPQPDVFVAQLAREHGSLSLMASAGRRRDCLHALCVPRPALAGPTMV